jgi:hypothetical protein
MGWFLALPADCIVLPRLVPWEAAGPPASSLDRGEAQVLALVRSLPTATASLLLAQDVVGKDVRGAVLAGSGDAGASCGVCKPATPRDI